MYTFIDKLFLVLVFFMYLLISPILFITIPSDEVQKNNVQPIIISIFFTYSFFFYVMIGSDCIFKKTIGYGLSVLPLLLLSNMIDP